MKTVLPMSTGFQITNFNSQRIDFTTDYTFKISNVILHKYCTGTAAT